MGDKRLEDLLDKPKPKLPKRKMGNTKRVWRKDTVSKSTIYLDGDE
jgi:hypothetical protein